MIIGYARVSTEDHHLDMQIGAIEKYAADKTIVCCCFLKKKADREELKKALDQLQQGDTFLIYKLNRLARSTKQLYEIHEDLDKRGVNFVSLSDSIDTNTAVGKAMLIKTSCTFINITSKLNSDVFLYFFLY
ncbi:recombinase family protein [Bacillus sp. EB600]|uniref:recombinase family protein n=1 Tax=Bacillus sp. EB600 TaxID=2806345 RepID=UPI00210E51E0|nr:recombinase family protein [Bacillus sp. EB600]MCQ6282197.1 recombinase family protein [Bacillus sp. EB600]